MSWLTLIACVACAVAPLPDATRVASPDGAFDLKVDRLGMQRRTESTLATLTGTVSGLVLRPGLPDSSGVVWVDDSAARRVQLQASPTTDPLTGITRKGPTLAELRYDRGSLRFAWESVDRKRYETKIGVIQESLQLGEIVCQHEGRDVLIIAAPPIERTIDPTKGRQRLGLPARLPAQVIDHGQLPSPWTMEPGSSPRELVLSGSGPQLTVFLRDDAFLDVFFAEGARDAMERAKSDLEAIESAPPPASDGAKRLHDGEITRLRQVYEAAAEVYRKEGDPTIAVPFAVTIRDADGGRPRAIVRVADGSAGSKGRTQGATP